MTPELTQTLEQLSSIKQRNLAITYAKRVISVWEKEYPNDRRPQEGLEVAQRFAQKKVTPEDAHVAWQKVWSAYSASGICGEAEFACLTVAGALQVDAFSGLLETIRNALAAVRYSPDFAIAGEGYACRSIRAGEEAVKREQAEQQRLLEAILQPVKDGFSDAT